MSHEPVPGWSLRRDRPPLHGAMGTVFFAEDASDPSRRAVIKCPKAETLRAADPAVRQGIVARFREEVALQRCVTHGLAPAVYADGDAAFPDYGHVVPYVVMEDCSDRVTVTPGMVREGLQLLVGTLQALHVLAALRSGDLVGLEHRDVKADNVWLLTSGRVVLMDFGLARWSNDRRPAVRFGRAGTPSMMPPEALDPHAIRPADRRADLYSAGAMTWEALTGSPPYPGRTDREILDAMLATAAIILLDPDPARDRAPNLRTTLGSTGASALEGILRGLLEKDVVLRTATAWEALEALARHASVTDLLGRDPRLLPFDDVALAHGSIATQLRALAGSEPTLLLVQALDAMRASDPAAYPSLLRSLWEHGALRPSLRTIAVDWSALRHPSWDVARLTGRLAWAATVVPAIDDALASADAVALEHALLALPVTRPEDVHDVLGAWATLRGSAAATHPAVARVRAAIAEQAGDAHGAYALLATLPSGDAVELRTRLAVQLNHPDAAALVEALPPTAAGALTRATYFLSVGRISDILTTTDALPAGADRATLLEVLNLRLRAALFLYRTAASKDPAACAAEAAAVDAELRQLAALAVPLDDLPATLLVTLGMVEGVFQRPEEMRALFARAHSRLRGDVRAVGDAYRMEETRFDVLRAEWREGRRTDAPNTLLHDIHAAAFAALEAAEKLRNPGRLINAITNDADSRALLLKERSVPSLTLDSEDLAANLAAVRTSAGHIRATVARARILLGGAFYEHDLALRKAERVCDTTDVILKVFEDLGWFAANSARASGKSLPYLSTLRIHLIDALQGKASAAPEALELSLRLLVAITRSSDLDTALRISLDELIAHFHAEWGRIDWGPSGCTPETITYRYGRRCGGVDLEQEPPSSMHLKRNFLEAADGKILRSTSPELLGSESVLYMGANCFLGVALMPFGAPRGVLMLVVNEEGTAAHTYGDRDKQLLKTVADTLATQLAFREKDDMLRSATTGGLLRVLSEEMHALKNDVKAAAELFPELDCIRTTELSAAVASGELARITQVLTGLNGILGTMQHHVFVARDLANRLMDELRPATRALPDTQPDTAPPASVRVTEGEKPGAASRASLGDPRDIVRLLDDLRGMASERGQVDGITVTRDVAPSIPLVRFDPMAVAQLFENIFNNSAYYLRRTTGRPRTFTVAVTSTETHVTVSLSDTGPGMTQEILNHVITGASTKGADGTGLGIPTVLRTMQLHWGTTEIRTQRGAGTTFVLSFPLGPPAADDAFGREEPAAPAVTPTEERSVEDMLSDETEF